MFTKGENMKLGEMKLKRRYTVPQVIVDIASLGALVYICFIVYTCYLDVNSLNMNNYTGADLSSIDWKPLILWIILGVIVCVISIILIFRRKKLPKKLCINDNNGAKYCNVIDTSVSCIRLIILLALSEGCYLHMAGIFMRAPVFSVQLLCDVCFILAILWFTKMRLEALSEAELQRKEAEKKTVIIQD